jgi:DNA polymerase-3 subunit gamma/tau
MSTQARLPESKNPCGKPIGMVHLPQIFSEQLPMATQVLYRKWRSQTFDQIIGQQHVTQTLQNALATDRVGHAYLFTGPRGTGKTSTARLLAKAANCTGEGVRPCNQCAICLAVTEGRLLDLIEIDAASNTSVDDIRDLRDKIDFRPAEARLKFYIIDEVHMLSKSAFNALLKTLEEPPPHVVFVLATTEPEKIPATIISRCQRFDFRRIKQEEVVTHLQFIAAQESLEVESKALDLIARQGSGSMRDSISLLDQLTSYGEAITLDMVRSVLGAADSTATQSMVDHILQGEAGAGLALVNSVIQDGVEPRQFALDILEYLRGLLLVKYDNAAQFLHLPVETIETMRDQSAGISAPKLLAIIERFNNVIKAFKAGGGEVTIPQLPLEMAIVESATLDGSGLAGTAASTAMANPQPAPPVAAASGAKRLEIILPNEPAPSVAATSESPARTEEATLSAKPQAVETDDGPISLSVVQARWNDIGAELKQRNLGMAQGLLNSGHIVNVQDDTIKISFPSDLLKKRIDNFTPAILEALESVFGAPIGIAYVVGEEAASTTLDPIPQPSPPVDSSAATAEKKSLYENDPLIQSALALGGKIKGTRPLDDIAGIDSGNKEEN